MDVGITAPHLPYPVVKGGYGAEWGMSGSQQDESYCLSGYVQLSEDFEKLGNISFLM